MDNTLNIILTLAVIAVIGVMTYFLSFQSLQAIDRLLWGISVHVNDTGIMTRRRDPITGRPTQSRPTVPQTGYDEGVRSLPWYVPGEEWSKDHREVDQ